MATRIQLTGYTKLGTPVLQSERWAVFIDYPVHPKVTEHLESAVATLLPICAVQTRDQWIYNWQIGIEQLRLYLCSLLVQLWATMIKLIHGWNPLQNFLYHQHRSDSPQCKRCNINMECREHLLIFPDDCAMQARFDLLQAMINTLRRKTYM
jgi:hypothetical protein